MSSLYFSVNEEQYLYLCDVKMKYVFSLVKILSHWVGSGFYDFCHLPLSLKMELKPTVVEEIHLRIKQCGPGKTLKSITILIILIINSIDPMTMTQNLIDVLIENENDIRKEVYQTTEVMDY